MLIAALQAEIKKLKIQDQDNKAIINEMAHDITSFAEKVKTINRLHELAQAALDNSK
jgi:hypothetical protein